MDKDMKNLEEKELDMDEIEKVSGGVSIKRLNPVICPKCKKVYYAYAGEKHDCDKAPGLY
ncbi:MAG: hypothetical protein ACI4D1_01675 [Lachnospira sp.]